MVVPRMIRCMQRFAPARILGLPQSTRSRAAHRHGTHRRSALRHTVSSCFDFHTGLPLDATAPVPRPCLDDRFARLPASVDAFPSACVALDHQMTRSAEHRQPCAPIFGVSVWMVHGEFRALRSALTVVYSAALTPVACGVEREPSHLRPIVRVPAPIHRRHVTGPQWNTTIDRTSMARIQQTNSITVCGRYLIRCRLRFVAPTIPNQRRSPAPIHAAPLRSASGSIRSIRPSHRCYASPRLPHRCTCCPVRARHAMHVRGVRRATSPANLPADWRETILATALAFHGDDVRAR